MYATPTNHTHALDLFDLWILNFTNGIKQICIFKPNLHILLPPFKCTLFRIGTIIGYCLQN